MSRKAMGTAASSATDAPKNLPPAVIIPQPDVNKDLPPVANAPRSASSSFSPPVTIPSPSVPLFQLPVANSAFDCASKITHRTTTPTGHAAPRQKLREILVKREPEKDIHMRYRDTGHRAMQNELSRRGLLCSGRITQLAKRLEKDDKFQAEPKTDENYDTMNPKDICDLCTRRSIPHKDLCNFCSRLPHKEGRDSTLRSRLKAHDKRKYGTEAAERTIGPLLLPSWPISFLEKETSRAMLDEKPPLPKVTAEITRVTGIAETIKQTAKTVNPANYRRIVQIKTEFGVLITDDRRTACDRCRQRRVCTMPEM